MGFSGALFLSVECHLAGRPDNGQRLEKCALKAGHPPAEVQDGLPPRTGVGSVTWQVFLTEKIPGLGPANLSPCRPPDQCANLLEAQAASSGLGVWLGKCVSVTAARAGGLGAQGCAFSGFWGRNSVLLCQREFAPQTTKVILSIL